MKWAPQARTGGRAYQADRRVLLESKNDDNWLTEQRAEEIRGLVHDVLADADTRSSLLQSGMTAGYDNGAVIQSDDGNWLLRTNIHMQQRFIVNNQDDGDDPAFDSSRWGFENTRTKFILTGHVVNPDWFYKIDINVGSNGVREDVGNAYLGYNYGNGFKVMMGSMKAPLLREELVDSQYQLAVERSVLNYAFTGGYVDGINLMYEQDMWRISGAYTDGAGTGQTTWGTFDTEFAFTVRGEVMFSGTWDQFNDMTAPPGSEQGIMVGAAFHYQIGESGTPASEPEIWILTVDASLEFDGWNLFAAFIYSDIDPDTTPSTDANPWGFLVQGGLYLSDDWELYARYEFGDADASGVEDLGIITFGVNRYFAGHNAKWTTDFGFAFDEIDSAFGTGLVTGATPAALTGWRTDAPDEDGQWVLRTQFQILF
jgi:hypothetical protein